MTNNEALVLIGSDSHDRALQLHNGDAIAVGSIQWFEWLKANGSFRFESGLAGQTSFTARKHERDSGDFWYAYRKIGGKLRNAYLGKSGALTTNRLLEAANKLVMYELGKSIPKQPEAIASLPNLLHNSTDLEKLKERLEEAIFHRDHFALELREARKQFQLEINRIGQEALDGESSKTVEIESLRAALQAAEQENSQIHARNSDLVLELANLREQMEKRSLVQPEAAMPAAVRAATIALGVNIGFVQPSAICH